LKALNISFSESKEKALFFLDISVVFLLSVIFLFADLNYSISWIALVLLFPFVGLRLVIDRDIYIPDKTIFVLIGFFIAVQILSSVFSVSIRESLFVVRRRAMLYMPFFAAVMFIKNLTQLKKILSALIVFTALISLYEIVRFFADPFFYSTPISELRIGYFGHPVTLGEIKMLVLVLIAVLIFSKENFLFAKKWLIALSVPIAAALFLTNSRGAWLGLLAALIVLGFLRNKKLVYVMTAGLVLFLILAPGPLKERMQSIIEWNNKGVQSRIAMWYTSTFIIHDYPILGVGSGDPINIYEHYRAGTLRFQGEGHHMHNNMIHLLVTTGMLGLAAWLALMVFIFDKQLKVYRQTKNKPILNDLALISVLSMIAFQVSGLTDWNFGDFAFSFVNWVFISFAFLAEKFNSSNETLKT
jgi:O-antigen ligase